MKPLPPPGLPEGCSRLLVVGGSFDPVHRAHIELPALARDHWHTDAWLLYIPAARSPFKANPPIAADRDRVRMLALALQDQPRAAIWTDEIDRATTESGPSYTIETLDRLREAVPSARELRLLMGVDQATSFHHWRNPREIIQRATPLVLLRDADQQRTLQALADCAFWSAEELELWKSWIAPTPLRAISATKVRGLLARHATDTQLEPMLEPAVIRYIREHHLYGS